MKKVLVVVSCLLLVTAVYLGYSTTDTASTPEAVAMHKEIQVYKGTVYVAGMGGHFAAADVEIDPADPKAPIKVTKLDRVVIGSKKTHPTHDPRIDPNDPSTMYWSTYKIDKAAGDRKAHVGKSNLKTGKVIKDQVVELNKRAKWTGALYCGSGQSKKYFLPVTMTGEAYIDVIDKKSLKNKAQVFLDGEGYKNNYWFFHGTNTPDMKSFAVAINLTEKWADASTPGKPKGEIDMLLLDMKSLEKGKVKVTKKSRITGKPGKTLTFRQTFTPDGKYLLQSGADRFYLLDGKTLRLLDEEMMTMGDNHDAISTPDGKYAVLTLRRTIKTSEDPEGKQMTDGVLALYDIKNRTVIGEPASVCYGCHANIGISGNATLCGADATWQ
jgi:hypothetical protein